MQWPEGSNLFGTIETTLSPADIAAHFVAAGWTSHKTGWYDYEVISEFAELLIDAASPVLIHGLVADIEDRARLIADVLGSARLNYSLECYGPEKELLFTTTSNSTGTV